MFLCIFLFVVSVRLSVSSAPLYAFPGPLVFQLSTIDPETAKMTPVGPVIPNLLFGEQLASIDKQNDMIYALGIANDTDKSVLVGLSLKTGELNFRVTLPYLSALLGVGQYVAVDPETGDVFTSGKMVVGESLKHVILRIEPSSSKVTQLAMLDGHYIDVLTGVSGYDPKNGVLYVEYGELDGVETRIFGFDVSTGKQTLSVLNSVFLETFAFDKSSGMMLGLGLRNQTRTIVTMDQAGTFTEVATIPGYVVILQSVATIDSETGALYCFLQKKETKDVGADTPYEFLTINLRTAKVLQSSTCYFDSKLTPACPWAIQSGAYD